jgi:glycosyltransferase involved in cell wall biosynthesis
MFYENEAIDKKFSALLDEIKPDIVHIHHLVFLSIGIIEEIRRRGIPMVFTLHDYWLLCPKWHLLKNNYQPCHKAEYGEFDKDCANCLEGLFHANSKTIGLYVLCKRMLPGLVVSYLKKSYLSFLKQMPNNHNVVMKLKSRASSIKTLLGKVQLFLAPSQCLMDRFIAFGIPQFKIKLSTFGLKDNFSSDLQENRSKKIRFGFIGTILPAKGLHVLINAFNGIKAKEIELRIYGKLYPYVGHEDYPSFLKKISKNKNIKFLGAFNHTEIANIFKEIDILVVPSIWQENSPFVIQEAFLFKTPVIASRIGGIPELLADGVNG